MKRLQLSIVFVLVVLTIFVECKRDKGGRSRMSHSPPPPSRLSGHSYPHHHHHHHHHHHLSSRHYSPPYWSHTQYLPPSGYWTANHYLPPSHYYLSPNPVPEMPITILNIGYTNLNSRRNPLSVDKIVERPIQNPRIRSKNDYHQTNSGSASIPVTRLNVEFEFNHPRGMQSKPQDIVFKNNNNRYPSPPSQPYLPAVKTTQKNHSNLTQPRHTSHATRTTSSTAAPAPLSVTYPVHYHNQSAEKSTSNFEINAHKVVEYIDKSTLSPPNVNSLCLNNGTVFCDTRPMNFTNIDCTDGSQCNISANQTKDPTEEQPILVWEFIR
ncbi:hypothetical protein FQR65_LT13041 [Abscondita terminalis]|nr:hypothetical protein FQR65_LT13041 [Abscondita terminalis]